MLSFRVFLVMARCLSSDLSFVGDSVAVDGVYVCPSGSYLLLTFEEVNHGVPLPLEPAHFAQAYAWGLGTVLTLWALGWVVGLVTGVIKKA